MITTNATTARTVTVAAEKEKTLGWRDEVMNVAAGEHLPSFVASEKLMRLFAKPRKHSGFDAQWPAFDTDTSLWRRVSEKETELCKERHHWAGKWKWAKAEQEKEFQQALEKNKQTLNWKFCSEPL